MRTHFQIKTLVRLVGAIAIGSVASFLFVEPKADAASEGYGVSAPVMSASAVDLWHDASLIEGRSVSAGR